MDLNKNDLESSLTDLLFSRLDFDAIRAVALVEVDHTYESGSNFSVRPFSDLLCEFTVSYTDRISFVNLEVAENTMLEVPLEGQEYTNKIGVEELLSLVKGIIYEGMEEIVWKLDNGDIVASTGTLFVESEGPITVERRSLYNPLAKLSREKKKYFPYFRH